MSDTHEPLAAILAEMRKFGYISVCEFADRIEAAVQRFVADDCAKCAHYHAATISLKDALSLANTIANHGINANDLEDKASATIYALCDEVRTVRGEDANIKQEVQKLRRELRDLRDAPGNAAAMREALGRIVNLAPEYPANGVDWNALAAEAFLTASSALAAPARNCDRFKTSEDAWMAFKRENDNAYFDTPGLCRFADWLWLFAPAEGGDHA